MMRTRAPRVPRPVQRASGRRQGLLGTSPVGALGDLGVLGSQGHVLLALSGATAP